MPLAHGGKGPYTYEVRHNNSGTLPNGIEFNTTSRGLSVNPSVTPVGVYVLEYKVTDSESPAQSVSQAFLVRVGPAPGVSIGTLEVPSPQSVTLEAGTSHVLTLPAATRANGNLLYDVISLDTAAQELPAGFAWDDDARTLTIDSSAAAGVHRFRYDVSDEHTTAADTFTVTIQAPIVLADIPDVTVYDDQNYSATLPASTGGSGARSYALQKVTEIAEQPAVAGSMTISPAADTTSIASRPGWGRDLAGTTFIGSNNNATGLRNAILGLFGDQSFSFVVVRTGTTVANIPSSITITNTHGTSVWQRRNNTLFSANTWGSSRNESVLYMIFTRRSGTSLAALNRRVDCVVTLTYPDGTVEPTGRDRVPASTRLDALPAGMTFDTATRLFSVADTTAVGENTLRYTATVGAASKTEDFSVTVDDDDLLKLHGTSVTVHKGADRAVTLPAATGGDTANIAYEIVEGPGRSWFRRFA